MVKIRESEIEAISERYEAAAEGADDFFDEVGDKIEEVEDNEDLTNEQRFAVEAVGIANEFNSEVIPDTIEEAGEAHEDLVESAVENFDIHVEEDLESDDSEEEEDWQKEEEEWVPKEYYARANLIPDQESGVEGYVTFQQTEGHLTKIYAEVTGLTDGPHGIHVHVYGDISQGCGAAGPHYNPEGVSYPYENSWEREVGDLGEMHSQNSHATYDRYDSYVELHGEWNNIMGRAIVVHATVTDEQKANGEWGARLACGPITQVPKF